MKNIRGRKFRLINEITKELDATVYTVIMEEEDTEIPELVWLYLESEYGDENVEYEPRYDIKYAKITNNAELRLVEA